MQNHAKIVKASLLGRINAQDLLHTCANLQAFDDLNITDAPKFRVKIRPLSSVPEGKERSGGAFASQSEAKGSRLSRLIKAPLNYFKLKAVNGLTLGRTPNTMYINDHYFLKNALKRNTAPLAGTILHELQHIFQMKRHEECLTSPYIHDRIQLTDKFSKLAKNDINFFDNYIAPRSSEHEIQARLASVIMRHTSTTGKLPLSTPELLNALQEQKISLPVDISLMINDELRESSKLDAVLDDANDLTLIFACVSPEHNPQLWFKDIPSLYADMLEDWGDQQGHKRFGHTHNIRFREIFYRSIEDAHKLETSTEFDEFWESDDPKIVDMITGQVAKNFARAADIIQKMDKDDAIDLGCLVLTGFRYKELGESNFEPPKAGNDNISDFTKAAILDRTDITERDRAILAQAENLYLPENNEQTRSTMREPDGSLHSSLTFMLDAA